MVRPEACSQDLKLYASPKSVGTGTLLVGTIQIELAQVGRTEPAAEAAVVRPAGRNKK